MRGLRTWIALGAIAATVAVAAPSQAVTIDFEDGVVQGQSIQNEYESDGVIFSGATVLTTPGYNFADYPAHSGKSVVYNSDGDIRLFFSSFTFDLSAYATTSAPLIMTVYGLDGVVLGSSLLSSNIGTMSLISYQGQGIASALFSTGGAGDFTLDDVSFGPAVSAAPEPATWAMLILGFGLVGATLRRRQKDFSRISSLA